MGEMMMMMMMAPRSAMRRTARQEEGRGLSGHRECLQGRQKEDPALLCPLVVPTSAALPPCQPLPCAPCAPIRPPTCTFELMCLKMGVSTSSVSITTSPVTKLANGVLALHTQAGRWVAHLHAGE